MSVERDRETKKASKPRETLAALGLVAVILALWYWWFLSPHSRHLAPTRAFAPKATSTTLDNSSGVSWQEAPPQIYAEDGSGRAVFPYSVVPGGIRSAQDLADAAKNDAVVAEHYGNFRVRSVHAIRLKKDRRAYVSYRLGDHIYWTRSKVTLHAGETLLSDGKNVARGRCGNRVSDTPKLPVSPKEPPDRMMSMPVFVPDPLPPGFPIGEPPLARITLSPESFGPPPDVPPGGPFPPFFPPIFPGGSGTPSTPLGPPPPPPPVVGTPEPASGLLVLLGLMGAAVAILIFKK
jgi:hypothetical protein